MPPTDKELTAWLGAKCDDCKWRRWHAPWCSHYDSNTRAPGIPDVN